ncbi:hypothetical protein GN244_ATG12674 [Phytophthora infestans]|uniref:Uncharacterized protein n=1 Tax=Phytophthora infestans TaxID=4787 RepID=A0A833SKY9_PHYIN|nr:hypothetical protein GN244_ATG13878 [Phytophthora infestans]KAF4035348.1 hypothetical protein GN244_ATG12674 [Phytophthora infestans]
MDISEILGRVGDEAGVYSFGGKADTLPATPGLEVKYLGTTSFSLSQAQARMLVANYQKTGNIVGNSTTHGCQLEPDALAIKNPA